MTFKKTRRGKFGGRYEAIKIKNDSIIKALRRKAEGFSADEIVEEYSVDGEGNLVLSKKKVTTKYFPPDTAAIKGAFELDEGISAMTDDELLAEKERLLKTLEKQNKGR
jgi:hypothetical protein